MNDLLLHQYAYQLEAPIRERAARAAAQLAVARAGKQPPVSFALRLRLGQALVSLGRAIQGPRSHHLDDAREAAT